MSLSTDRNDGQDYFFRKQTTYGGKIAKKLTLAKGINWLDVSWTRVDQGLNIKYILESLIANGIEAINSIRTTAWVAVPRSDKHYTDKIGIYGRCTKAGIDLILAALQKNNYICISEHRQPWTDLNNKKHKGRCTAYRLTDEFLDFLEKSISDYKSTPLVDSDAGTCIIKDRETDTIIGRDVDIEKRLKIINRWLAQHVFLDHHKHYFVPAYKAVHIQGIGGRIYDNSQQTPEIHRALWTIDQEPVVSYDITACHTALAYIKNNKVLSDDPYVLDATTGIGRPLVKLIVNRLLNARTELDAIKTIICSIRPKAYTCFYSKKDLEQYLQLVQCYNTYIEHITNNTTTTHPSLNIDITSMMKSHITTGKETEKSTFEVHFKAPVLHKYIRDMIYVIRHKHTGIEHEFGNDFGVVGQAYEGQLGLALAEACRAVDIPVLNLFDGFYVKRSQSAAFEAIFRQTLDSLGLSALRYKIK